MRTDKPKTIAFIVIFTVLLSTLAFEILVSVPQSKKRRPELIKEFDAVILPEGSSKTRNFEMFKGNFGYVGGDFSSAISSDRIIEHFQGTLPKSGWQLRNTYSGDPTVLVFCKEAEGVHVQVFQNPIGRFTFMAGWGAFGNPPKC